MTEAERTKAVAKLASTRERFKQAVAGLSEAQGSYKPSPERWSIAEIAEHVAIVEHGLYRLISELHERSDDPHEEQSAATLALAAHRKKMPIAAPERSLPKGRFGGVDDAVAKFVDNRERSIEFVKNCTEDLRFRLIPHPLGKLNGRDGLTVLTYHPIRHIEQIEEVKASVDFPR